MGYWKSTVAPKIKKIFDKDGKKAAAADFSKSFNRDEISNEVEEKKNELQPKVVVVYEAASAEIKALVKERKQSGVKRHSLAVTKFLEGLITIEFPGAKQVSEAAAASGPALVAGPVLFVFEKVSGFVVTEEPKAATEETASREVAAAVVEEKKAEVEEAAAGPAGSAAPEPAEPAPEPASEPAEPAEETTKP